SHLLGDRRRAADAMERARCKRPRTVRPWGGRIWLSLAGALCAGIIAIPLPTSGLHAQSAVVVAPDGVYVHAPSAMAFPPTVGAFHRAAILQYDEEGRDVSVGYEYRGSDGRIAATVYVYPAPSLTSIGSSESVVAEERARLMEREFNARKREVLSVTPDARLVAEGETILRQGRMSYAGRRAEFVLERVFSGQRQRLGSELYIFGYVGGEWIVKYRFTYPVALDAADHIAVLMRDLKVTIPPES